MNVLSLFNGMSCGYMALESIGVKIDNYYSSEIDRYSNKVSKALYPSIKRLGDVLTWPFWDLPEIDLLIGGSPCQGFSMSGKGLNFKDPRSKLFFTFVDCLKAFKPKYFLLENVCMKKEIQDRISELIRCEPLMINSALVSAQNRKRLYWTNIPNVDQPEDKGILLKHILENGITEKDKSYCIDANYYKGSSVKQYKKKCRRQLVQRCIEVGKADIKGKDMIKRIYSPEGKCLTLTAVCGGNQEKKVAVDDFKWRKLTPRECARLQTIPEDKIDIMLNCGVSNTQLYKMLGNGWTIDVISHILKGVRNNGN